MELWEKRVHFLGNAARFDPIKLFTPENAARHLGYDYQLLPEILALDTQRDQLAIAGNLDQRRRLISVSERFDLPVQRFTGAHEIGHIRLGHEGHVIHREIPHERQRGFRNVTEQEADHWAACYLIPRGTLAKAIYETFGLKEPIVFDEAMAFWLCPDDMDAIVRPEYGSNMRARCLSRCHSFGGRQIVPLHQQFKVSVSAMANRLDELKITES